MMNLELKQKITRAVSDFRLPRYREIPTVGLYLEQVTTYINGFIAPAGCAELTSSMVSNYVKKGFIAPPVKKQYGAEQIAYLIFIAVSKHVLSLEHLVALMETQKDSATLPQAYDIFCCELEDAFAIICGVKPESCLPPSDTLSEERLLLRRVTLSVSHSLYLELFFAEQKNCKIT
ncbi:MAG: DUF1836 domain-containing protein [Clostridia bacterium]|nr:DUF1836 domain-containing protein [Clostridia bacterium]